MQQLTQTLNSLLDTLKSLEVVINDEQALLCNGHVNGVALQCITEKKSSLLTTLNYMDTQRSHAENDVGIEAPYTSETELNILWQEIQQRTEALKHINNNNGLLLDQQISYNSQALAILNKSHTRTTYGPNGLSRTGSSLGRKISI